jgi:hypothetical protein
MLSEFPIPAGVPETMDPPGAGVWVVGEADDYDDLESDFDDFDEEDFDDDFDDDFEEELEDEYEVENEEFPAEEFDGEGEIPDDEFEEADIGEDLAGGFEDVSGVEPLDEEEEAEDLGEE